MLIRLTLPEKISFFEYTVLSPLFFHHILLQSLKWREEWEVEKIKDWEPPEVLQKYYPSGISGFDKEGSPGMRTKPVSSNTILLITHHLKTLALFHKTVTTHLFFLQNQTHADTMHIK